MFLSYHIHEFVDDAFELRVGKGRFSVALWKKNSEFLILYELFHVLYALLTGGVFVVFADFQVLVVKDSFVGMGIILKDLDNPVGIEEMI